MPDRPSSSFSVVAIIAAYNEADIIDQVVSDLLKQDVQVYFLDDGSTDGTLAAVERYLGQGVLGIERLPQAPEDARPRGFDLEGILRRKAALAQELNADWFINHDADEFRESPWPHVSLNAAIRQVDALGFNAIDFALLDFPPAHNRFLPGDDVRQAFTFYAAPEPYDRLQIRCWKKTDALVDLASTGGHEARFPGRNVFPLRFILRHYPIRGQAHGERKVTERRSRFLDRERATGWHVQYDQVHEGHSFIRDPSTLTPYDPDAVRLGLTLRHRGVEELQAEVETLLTALAARAAELERLREEVDQRSTQIEQLTSAVDESVRRLDELHRSLSWRWMAPARAAYRVLRQRD